MHLESMDEEFELQWEDLKNGYVTVEIELDGCLNPCFLFDRNESHIYIFNLTCNDVIVKDAQQSGNSHAASDDFAQMKISDVPQDSPHSNGSAYRGRASGRDGVGTSADSHFMASELLPNGTLPNNGWKLFKRSSKRSHSLKIEVIPSTHEKISQHALAVSMLSSEGFEGDEKESRAPSSKKPAPTFASQLSTPITKPTVAFPKKSPFVSNNFMNALSAVSSVNAMELQRKRKKPPPVIDLPLSSPLDAVVITPTTASVAGTVPPPDPLGPDPTRVSAPSGRRRIHFADDNGEALVHTKLIENVLNNKAHRPNSDMKHAYAKAERISLKQMKTDADEDDEMRMKMPEMGNIEVDSSWRLIPYYKNAQNQFSQHLIDEEEARHGNVMRTFVAQSDVPIEHPSEPDDVENAVTKFREPETIPIDFAIEETVEQEPREVDAPASPDTLSANVSTVSPVTVPNFARAYLLQVCFFCLPY
uniref:Uncharacterized protein n=1 Tax=Panagrolaimus davidi TaxID=227884 RepID=A0A914R359_9BILA